MNDCSCRLTSNQHSLNSCLVAAPPFLTDMCTLLLRFRIHRFTLTTDIKASLYAQLVEENCNYIHFLRLSSVNNPVSDFIVFWLSVILFGSVSSLFTMLWDVISQLKHQISLAKYWLISMLIMLSKATTVKPTLFNTKLNWSMRFDVEG